MANIKSGVNGVTGFQGTDEACGQTSIYNLRQHIDTIFAQSNSGSAITDGTAASASGTWATMKNFECGHAYIFYRNAGSNATFNISNFVQGNPESRTGAVTTRYPMEFSIEGKGTFHITAGYKDPGVSGLAWFNEHPVYKTTTNSNKIWYDGNSYVLSTKVGDKSGSLDNESILPNISYSDAHVTSSHTIEISGFTSSSAAANGLYAEVGYLNSKPVYRHGKYNYYYFFNGTHWMLSNTAFHTGGSACYIKGTADVFGPLNNANSTSGRCFDNQIGNARDGEVDPRSLATEAVNEKLLATEAAEAKVLITESD